MAFIVVYDANVLYPDTLRDLLIRVSQVLQSRFYIELLSVLVEWRVFSIRSYGE